MSPGWFIALEGPDGSGKSTQAQRLAAWLRGQFSEVISCRDPGGTELGERIRPVLMERTGTAIGMRAEMLLYMASRAQLVDEVIRPAVARGSIVVSDRFLLSNVVYQGHAGGLPPDEIWQVGRVATSSLLPDLTLLIDVPTEIARVRIGPARDRIEDRGPEYQHRVRLGYLDAVQQLTSPYRVIDGARSADVVEVQIRNEVRSALGIGSRT